MGEEREANIDEREAASDAASDDVEGHSYSDSPNAESPTAEKDTGEGADVEGHMFSDSPNAESPNAE